MNQIRSLPMLTSKLGLKTYLSSFRKFYSGCNTFRLSDGYGLVRAYPKWRRSLRTNHWEGPLQDCVPWITFAAIRFLERALRASDTVFEYGMGGSTIFFAKRVKVVVSVEHDPDWHRHVLQKLHDHQFRNIVASCIQPDALTPGSTAERDSFTSCLSSDGQLYSAYVKSVNDYPDNYFDLISIDGRARPSCIKEARAKVKPGKYLLLDNSDRAPYQKAINYLLSGWTRRTFGGPTPYLTWFTETSVWRKPFS